MAIQATHGKVVLHFVSGTNGLSEVYHFAQTDYATLLTLGRTLCLYRMFFSADFVQLLYARASLRGQPREAKMIDLNFPVTVTKNLANQEPLEHTTWVGLHYRFETPDGRLATRIFRGIPDGKVYDGKYVGVPPKPLALNEALGDPSTFPNGNREYLQRSFLRWLITNTKHVRKIVDGANISYDVTDWTAAVYSGVTKRDVGRPFGLFRGRRHVRRAPVQA